MSQTYPSLRCRPGKNLAVVTLTDADTGKRRDFYLGPFGSDESKERYHQLIAQWDKLERRLPNPPNSAPTDSSQVTVAEIINEYRKWAVDYYQPNETNCLLVALRLLRQVFGSCEAVNFGPMRLRELRDQMIAGDTRPDSLRQPWSRRYINSQIKRIQRMFKWAAAREMIPITVYQSLVTMEALKRGRCSARENPPIRPVAAEQIEAVRTYLSRQVRAMIDLQRFTGARGGELVKLRPMDIDRSGELWSYSPTEHKTAYLGKPRILLFGPQAQAVLKPFLDSRPPEAYCFSPAEAEQERRAALHARRRTPLSCGNAPGSNRQEHPQRKPREYFDASSYAMAIKRACDQAFPPPEHLRRKVIGKRRDGSEIKETKGAWLARLTVAQKVELAAWRKRHRWHPHQLRHAVATAIRRQFGLEAAQLTLGHSSALVTDAVYAERDYEKVASVMAKIG